MKKKIDFFVTTGGEDEMKKEWISHQKGRKKKRNK
jgi:hypothetical protein